MSRKHRSAAQWQETINLFEQSDLTVTEFCHEHNVSHSGFYHWRKRLNGESKAEVTANDWQSVTIPDALSVKSTETEWDIELSLPNGVTLRMRR